MPNDFGFDFRNTQAFVTDPSYATYVIGDTYPTTRTVNGVSVTFGWETFTGGAGRDRSNTVDSRLAGINFTANTIATITFRVDLPASGAWNIGLALGDAAAGNAQTNYVVVEDGTTPLITFSPLSTSTTVFGDAAGNTWTPAAWPGSNVTVSKTFASTICRVVLGGTVAINSSCIAHLRLTQSTTAFTKALADTVTLVETFKLATSIKKTEVLTINETIKFAITAKYAEVITIVETIKRSITVKYVDTVTLLDSLKKATSIKLADVFTLVDKLNRGIAVKWNELISIVEFFGKVFQGFNFDLNYFRKYMLDSPKIYQGTSTYVAPEVETDPSINYYRQYLGKV